MRMEFNERLQELRKRRGLTQEELAQKLYVSRTAVSRWESGRGYPGIDSLKAIAAYFSITVDELLSSNEALTLAEQEHKCREARWLDLTCGLLDLSMALLWFVPLLGQQSQGMVQAVSLLRLTEAAPYVKAAYWVMVLAMMGMGVLTLALQNCTHPCWVRNRRKGSLLLHAAAALVFILTSQPYAAAFLFVFLLIKGFLLLNRP